MVMKHETHCNWEILEPSKVWGMYYQCSECDKILRLFDPSVNPDGLTKLCIVREIEVIKEKILDIYDCLKYAVLIESNPYSISQINVGGEDIKTDVYLGKNVLEIYTVLNSRITILLWKFEWDENGLFVVTGDAKEPRQQLTQKYITRVGDNLENCLDDIQRELRDNVKGYW